MEHVYSCTGHEMKIPNIVNSQDFKTMNRIEELILADEQRMKVLNAVAAQDLPDGYVAAGFVRNLVWDYLHGFVQTPLNDVDVIYFDDADLATPEVIELELYTLLPNVKWEVRNQALMHIRNGDEPYRNSADAMSYWPEKETAVGVRLKGNGAIKLLAPFGIGSLLSGCITYNPKRPKSVFEQRVKTKGWLKKWPRLRVVA